MSSRDAANYFWEIHRFEAGEQFFVGGLEPDSRSGSALYTDWRRVCDHVETIVGPNTLAYGEPKIDFPTVFTRGDVSIVISPHRDTDGS